ncbi:sensor histidine kinase [Actinoplanes sp. CA-142083]|uniref:sensor histidine kinase n=1 Tax=Actinoplanes sp. CA-142083 TaxID=3239903 RepID=UPI003D94A73F
MGDQPHRLPGLGEAMAAVAVLFLGLVEYETQPWLGSPGWRVLYWLVVLGTAMAIALVRRAPWLSLTLAWLIPICQVLTGTPVVFTQVAVLGVAFGVARWGGWATLWASGVSIPAGSAVAVFLFQFLGVRINLPVSSADLIANAVRGLGIGWQIGVALVFMAVLGAPWLAGVALRTADRARDEVDQAARERARAEETARIRDAQTRLARDVHDVVGHSLAVILAQAESGQYLPDENPAALKSALATIATSARTSLREVRDVLSATRDDGLPATRDDVPSATRDDVLSSTREGVLTTTREGMPATSDGLEKLIGNLRASGHEVVSGQDGTPLALGEARQVVAYRVLQEMLTNAIRHGRRDSPVIVRRSWAAGALIIEVRNAAGAGAESKGSGVDGMRERLAAVGGDLWIERREDVFVATARIPAA